MHRARSLFRAVAPHMMAMVSSLDPCAMAMMLTSSREMPVKIRPASRGRASTELRWTRGQGSVWGKRLRDGYAFQIAKEHVGTF
jgi:hypothetical protein